MILLHNPGDGGMAGDNGALEVIHRKRFAEEPAVQGVHSWTRPNKMKSVPKSDYPKRCMKDSQFWKDYKSLTEASVCCSEDQKEHGDREKYAQVTPGDTGMTCVSKSFYKALHLQSERKN